MAKMGRPTKYKDYFPQLVYWMAKAGLTDKELSKKLCIDERTLANWKNEYPEFFQAIKNGKNAIDDLVEGSLLRRALGYEYDEETYEIPKQSKDLEADPEPKLTKRVTKQVVPDVTAQIFWLKNRRSADWKDRKFVDVTNEKDEEWFNLMNGLIDGPVRKTKKDN